MPKLASPRLIGAAALAPLLAVAVLVLPATAPAAEPLPLQVTPSPAVFPATTVGEKSNLEIEIVNPGETASIEKIALEGSGAAAFTSQGNSCGLLAEGEKCTLTVAFTPGELGEITATAAIRFVGGERSEETFELRGTGVAPNLSFSPSSVDFGVQAVNSGSQERTVTVKNEGSAPTQINFVNFFGDSSGFGFDSNACSGHLLQPTDTCTIRIFFGPNEVRPYSVQLQVNAAGQVFTANITGEGARPELKVTPNPVDFGPATVAGSGSVQTVTLNNTGVLPVGFFIAVISGGDAGSFHLLDENCTASELKPGDSCTAEVSFAPLGAGAKSARLSMFGNGEGGMQIPLAGEGVPAVVSLTPASYDFGRVGMGSKSKPRSFAVRNSGASPVELGAVAIFGADLDQFTLSSDTCTGATLGAGEECQVAARFAPDSAGTKSATLRITGNAARLSVPLSGNATSDRVGFQWRAVAGRVRNGTALRVGTAKCDSAASCKVTIATQLKLVPRGKGRVEIRALPKLHVQVRSRKSQKLDVRLPRSVRKLLREGRATVRMKASWTTAGKQGDGGTSAKLR